MAVQKLVTDPLTMRSTTLAIGHKISIILTEPRSSQVKRSRFTRLAVLAGRAVVDGASGDKVRCRESIDIPHSTSEVLNEGRVMMHALTVDQHLLETAKARAETVREMAVSAEQLFATLEDGPSWTKWTPIRAVTWKSPKPFACGTTRTLALAGGINLDEVFWAWEPNRHMGFSVSAASVGWLNALTEVYEIAPLSSERCKVRWVVAVSFAGWLGKIEPGIGRVFQISQMRLLKKLERVARAYRMPA